HTGPGKGERGRGEARRAGGLRAAARRGGTEVEPGGEGGGPRRGAHELLRVQKEVVGGHLGGTAVVRAGALVGRDRVQRCLGDDRQQLVLGTREGERRHVELAQQLQ